MTVEIVACTQETLGPYRDGIVAVYREAFGRPPYLEGPADCQRFEAALDRHAARPGLRCRVAWDPDRARVVGFAHGYSGQPEGSFWDLVAAAVDRATVSRWLDGAFEFVELAVHPAAWRQGIGSGLHDALLTGLPHRTAVLATLDQDTPARRLYERKGWVAVVRGFRFPGGATDYVVLARDLAPVPKAG